MQRLFCISGLMMALTTPGIAADLTFSVTNVSEPVGQLMWVLYDSAEAYAGEGQPVVSAKSRLDSDSVRITLHDLVPGRYAIKLFHDANSNGELDTNLIGMPTEGYGFSNNAGRMGPPSFDDAAVDLKNDTAIEIKVR
ncbi:DUF2141 domain-containing protein [Congregibacter sp.]|uniref:DUF2141 domain-containing protein n=1 Tax=Congregibacter sp. TaxID=2744308 RepID=UPI003858E672